MKIIEASVEHIELLTIHRVKMFEEIRNINNTYLSEDIINKLKNNFVLYLRKSLPCELCKGWIVISNNLEVSSGMISELTWPPIPGDDTDKAALLHNMYTEKPYRNKGYAKRIVEVAIKYCINKNYKWIVLGASEAGRPIYESFGFKDTKNEMKLFL